MQIEKLHTTPPTGLYELNNFCHPGDTDTLSVPNNLARCDMNTDGGGWLVIQRRLLNGNTNFKHNWQEYEDGFGDLEGEFWYGLRNIHCLTSRWEMVLRIDMETTDGVAFNWTYETVQVGGPHTNYTLTLGAGHGTKNYMFDAVRYHNGNQFSMYDVDNDKSSSNCAVGNKGGWWYNRCHEAKLNGRHGIKNAQWIVWHNNVNYVYLQSVEMKIRPTSCTVDVC